MIFETSPVPIPAEHLPVCKMGQGHDCCRYIVMGPDGFSCVKKTTMRYTLDARGDAMTARADNCDGLPKEQA